MTIVDSGLIVRRLQSLIPGGWFGSTAPIRDAVIGGLADALANSYDLLSTVRAGTRRATTTGWLLDVDAFGFLGDSLLRIPGESDDAFRARYIAEILRPRGRRPDIIKALTDLTGRAPTIIEPWNPGDCGGWDTPALAWSGAQVSGGPIGGYDAPYAGWDVGNWGFDVQATLSLEGSTGAGCWGSLEMPNQIFIDAYRTPPVGLPFVAGWDSGAGGWDVGAFAWIGDDTNDVTAPDAEIYAAINRSKAAGVIAWTSIQS